MCVETTSRDPDDDVLKSMALGFGVAVGVCARHAGLDWPVAMALQTAPRLRFLEIGHARRGTIHVLSALTGLERLEIYDCEDVGATLTACSAMTALTELRLDGYEDTPSLDALAHLSELRVLQLQITCVLRELPPCLASFTDLRVLRISGDGINIDTFRDGVLGRCTELRELKIQGRVSHFRPDVAALTKLTTLVISYPEDSVEDAAVPMPRAISTLTSLENLSIVASSLSSIQSEGDDWASVLLPLTRLTWLGLHGNFITRLPPSFSRLTHLRALDLAHTDLDDGSLHTLSSMPLEHIV